MFSKFASKLAVVAAMIGCSIGTAHAIPFAWSDTQDPPDFTINANSPYSFTHSILGGLVGFRPGIDTITSASLTVLLFDDNVFGDLPLLGDGRESVSFMFDGSGWTSPQPVDFLSLFNFSLGNLLSDGTLDVTVRATRGDFRFETSLLVVTGDRSLAAIPEPATLALFGLGLLGLGVAASRRKHI